MEEQESYVLFDSYKKVAAEIATRYDKDKYGNAFKEVDIYPRNYKRKARALLKEGNLWNAYLEFQSEDQVKEAGQSDPNNTNTSNLRKQLIGLGFKNLFTAQEALEKPKQVIDLQPRWYNAYEHFTEQYEKPGLKQIEVWQSEIKALKGKRDKESNATETYCANTSHSQWTFTKFSKAA